MSVKNGIFLISITLHGCQPEECDRDLYALDDLPDRCLTECERRVRVANQLARAHAADCTFEPEALEEQECGGTDRRPELTYYATWCDLASLVCIRDVGGAEREELCFGAP